MEELLQNILQALDFKARAELTILDEQQMQTLNLRTRGKNEVTDVLSFPNLAIEPEQKVNIDDYPLEIEDGYLFLGSIALCLERAREQAIEYGHSLERETAYLIVHGVLHLLGYDHIVDEDKAKMRKREEEILQQIGVQAR